MDPTTVRTTTMEIFEVSMAKTVSYNGIKIPKEAALYPLQTNSRWKQWIQQQHHNQ